MELVRKSYLMSVLCSTIIPGTGQYYSEQKFKAGVFWAAELSALALVAYYAREVDRLTVLYNNKIRAYNDPNLPGTVKRASIS